MSLTRISNCSEFLLAALGCLALATLAAAQSAPPPPPPVADRVFVGEMPPGGPGPAMGFSYLGLEGSFGGKVIKGAPYSAQTTSETLQTLADGNRISRKTTGQIYRDSEGRTRRENSLPAIGPVASAGEAPQMVVINDVVSGTHFMLDSRQKIARTIVAHPGMPFEHHGHLATTGRPHAKPQIESLGTQTIDGLVTVGTRITMTIPAGEIGNELPIVAVSERWYSTDLQTVVMVKHTDPRIGESVFRLINVSRAEPDASLFAVPADYTVKEGHEFGRGKIMMQEPPLPLGAIPPGEEN